MNSNKEDQKEHVYEKNEDEKDNDQNIIEEKIKKYKKKRKFCKI